MLEWSSSQVHHRLLYTCRNFFLPSLGAGFKRLDNALIHDLLVEIPSLSMVCMELSSSKTFVKYRIATHCSPSPCSCRVNRNAAWRTQPFLASNFVDINYTYLKVTFASILQGEDVRQLYHWIWDCSASLQLHTRESSRVCYRVGSMLSQLQHSW